MFFFLYLQHKCTCLLLSTEKHYLQHECVLLITIDVTYTYNTVQVNTNDAYNTYELLILQTKATIIYTIGLQLHIPVLGSIWQSYITI